MQSIRRNSGFADGWRERSEQIRIARKLSRLCRIGTKAKLSERGADCRQRVELLCDSTTRNSFFADNQAANPRQSDKSDKFFTEVSWAKFAQLFYLNEISKLPLPLRERENCRTEVLLGKYAQPTTYLTFSIESTN